MNTFSWLIRREFWENKAIWIVPASVGGLLLLTSLFGKVDIDSMTTTPDIHAVGGMMLFAFGILFFVVMSLYSTWYLMDCLYADRKDRSVLFWKSLPVSDTATVLSKLAMALIVIPLVYFIAADITTLLIAFIISARASALIGGALWHLDLWLKLQELWLYLLVTTTIWYLPVAAWLLLVSAWAKRAVMLWSVLPPVALILAGRWILGSDSLALLLSNRLFTGYGTTAFTGHLGGALAVLSDGGGSSVVQGSVWPLLNPIGFFSSPATWGGAAVGIAFVAGAIQLRLRRSEAS